MGDRVPPKLSQHRPPAAGQVKGVDPSILRRTPALDESSPLQVIERRRQGRLVAPARPAQRRLRQAGILIDQQQNGKAAGLEVARADPLRKGAEGFPCRAPPVVYLS